MKMVKKKSRKPTKADWEELGRAIKEAKKDPQFMKELDEFIKITTS